MTTSNSSKLSPMRTLFALERISANGYYSRKNSWGCVISLNGPREGLALLGSLNFALRLDGEDFEFDQAGSGLFPPNR